MRSIMSCHTSSQFVLHRGIRKLAILLAAFALSWTIAPRPVLSAEPLRDSSSLRFIPADTAVYYSRLRLGQQFDAIAKSNAWARLLE